MTKTKLCESDLRFMDVVWKNEPMSSRELVELCSDALGWKKSTTYTMIKKMSDKGYLKNENCMVSSLISKPEVQQFESDYIVRNTFDGSLPAFIASFIRNKPLSREEIEEIRCLIDRGDYHE